jgi:hypothetical protein
MGSVIMKNLKFIVIIAILTIISNMITAKLCEIRMREVETKIDSIEYDMNTIDEVIREVLK